MIRAHFASIEKFVMNSSTPKERSGSFLRKSNDRARELTVSIIGSNSTTANLKSPPPSPAKGLQIPQRKSSKDLNHSPLVSPSMMSPLINGIRTQKRGISVLITQCIQEDIVGIIHPGESNPNSLHIGMMEAKRLLGDDPAIGPVSRLMKWARLQDPEELQIIHIRDWHAKNEPESQEHLDLFGVHCMQNTRGAELVLGLGKEVEKRPNETYVNSTGLTDFEGTKMAEVFEKIKKKAKGGEIRVGVVGVWTEAKVTFLFYDLKTRLNIKSLGTCSALTAGNTRAQHFNALDQMEKLLRITVTHSLGEFTQWLLQGGKEIDDVDVEDTTAPLSPSMGSNSLLEINGLEDDLSSTDLKLLQTCASIQVTKLTGGFSGALVYKIRGYDMYGHKLAVSVVKIGPTKMIAREMVNFERVEEVLGNNAPRVKGFVDVHDRAGIRFAYASMGEDKISTFENVYRSDASQDRITSILTFVFEEILGRFYAVSQYERLNILDCYNFDGKGWAWFKGGTDTPDKVKERVKELLEIEDGGKEYLIFPGNVKFRNVVHFLQKDLPNIPKRQTESHYVSYVHGDLNGSNILLDSNNNVWLIDFFFTERTHVLKDTTKIENDILFLFTDIKNEQEFTEALIVIQAIIAVEDLGETLPDDLEGVTTPSLQRAWKAIKILRLMTIPLVKFDRNPMQMSVALLRYALHNLCLDGLTIYQRRLSLAAACGHAEVIKRKVDKEKSPLQIYWFDYPIIKGQGRLGITILPGRSDKGRNLEDDIETLMKFQTKRLICLCQEIELERAEVSKLPSELQKNNIQYKSSPIKDQTVPSMSSLFRDVDYILEGLKHNESVVVCCNAGLGRSGVLVACALVASGLEPEEAIRTVRKIRGTYRAIERKLQEKAIANFAKTNGTAFMKKRLQVSNF